MNDFLVILTSPLLSGPFEVEVTASSEAAAKSRVRGLAFHHFRSEHMLAAECSVEPLGLIEATVNGVSFEISENEWTSRDDSQRLDY